MGIPHLTIEQEARGEEGSSWCGSGPNLRLGLELELDLEPQLPPTTYCLCIPCHSSPTAPILPPPQAAFPSLSPFAAIFLTLLPAGRLQTGRLCRFCNLWHRAWLQPYSSSSGSTPLLQGWQEPYSVPWAAAGTELASAEQR